jgi:CHAT domain-containing protein/Tfp pilus assembly protein PilF
MIECAPMIMADLLLLVRHGPTARSSRQRVSESRQRGSRIRLGWLAMGGRVMRLSCSAAVLTAVLALVSCRRAPLQGVVVEEALAGGVARQAGLTEGDVLLRWEVTPTAGDQRGGEFKDPLALAVIEVEDAPRGRIVLHGRRGREPFSWPLPPGEWRIRTEPRLATDALRSRYEKVRTALLAGRGEGAAEGVALAGEIEGAGRAREATGLLLQVGDLCLEAKLWPQATAAFQNARSAAQRAAAPDLEVRGWEGEAMAALKTSDLAHAEAAYREALRVCESRPDGAQSLACALTRTRVAHVAYQRGQLDLSEEQWQRSLEVRERTIPQSLPTANSLNGLGMVAAVRGRLDEAEDYFRKALALGEVVAPESGSLAHMLTNCGYIARHRGDLATAEHYYRRGLALFEKVDPEGADLATALQHLGVLARERGDLDAAEAYLRRTLGILEAQAPDSPRVASCLINLGGVHEDREQRERALSYYRRAEAINERIAPDGTEMAITLANLASVTAAAGDTKGAAKLYERVLAIRRKRAPRSLEIAKTLGALGRLALAQKDPARAVRLHTEALALQRRLAPNSAAEAESLYQLGTVLRHQGRRREALARWTEAIRALEAQRSRSSVSAPTRGTLGARYASLFADAVELAVELGERERAFHLLERSRARGFLAMLAERDLSFATADAPAALLREQRETDRAYDTAQERLARLQPGRDDAAIDKELAQMEELRHRRAQTAAEVRRTSPRLASLQEPEPLDLVGARQALDPGTCLLSYSVGADRTMLFVVKGTASSRPALEVVVLPFGRKVLQQRVAAFRGLIERGRETGAPEPALATQGRRLFDDLIGPAGTALAGARRLLIVPDGPLHALPFAALVMGEGPRYLIDAWPLHVTASATVYAELKKRGPPAARTDGLTLLAFGDPRYGDGQELPPDLESSVLARAERLAALPATRAEVAAIAALYPGTSRTYVGDAATEARAKAEMPRARLIHIAGHGLLDARFPLDSALALARDDGDNGLLQAWEVIEIVRIDADLVTLSACETGLGRDMGGEGLVGLTRAFQHAGARSVLASQWKVSDRSTALLMERFYRGLQGGLSKDAALRAAQIEMRGNPAYAHPYHWAAFQLVGLSN